MSIVRNLDINDSYQSIETTINRNDFFNFVIELLKLYLLHNAKSVEIITELLNEDGKSRYDLIEKNHSRNFAITIDICQCHLIQCLGTSCHAY